jgi:uncharacterized membrane protein YgdD (TMEM256/DUF423 family)
MHRTFLMIGALSGAISVAAGAFGAHALREKVEPRLLEVFETGARYQMYHALALIAVGLIASRWPSGLATSAGWLFVAGTLFFTGSLYAMILRCARAWRHHADRRRVLHRGVGVPGVGCRQAR